MVALPSLIDNTGVIVTTVVPTVLHGDPRHLHDVLELLEVLVEDGRVRVGVAPVKQLDGAHVLLPAVDGALLDDGVQDVLRPTLYPCFK